MLSRYNKPFCRIYLQEHRQDIERYRNKTAVRRYVQLTLQRRCTRVSRRRRRRRRCRSPLHRISNQDYFPSRRRCFVSFRFVSPGNERTVKQKEERHPFPAENRACWFTPLFSHGMGRVLRDISRKQRWGSNWIGDNAHPLGPRRGLLFK